MAEGRHRRHGPQDRDDMIHMTGQELRNMIAHEAERAVRLDRKRRNRRRNHRDSDSDSSSERSRRHRRNRKDKKKGCTYKTFKSCNPPEFNGEKDAVSTMKWIREMEAVIKISNCKDDQAVKYAVHSFKSEALFWWDTILHASGEEVVDRWLWKDLRKKVISRFCPDNELERIEREFLDLQVGKGSHREYVTRLTELGRLVPHQVSTEKKWITRYLWGLSDGMRALVRASRPKTFQEAIEIGAALETDRLRSGASNGKNKRKLEEAMKDSEDEDFESPRREGDRPQCQKCQRNHVGECRVGQRVCYRCGKEGHFSFQCTNLGKGCFSCGKAGHVKENCPELKKLDHKEMPWGKRQA